MGSTQSTWGQFAGTAQRRRSAETQKKSSNKQWEKIKKKSAKSDCEEAGFWEKWGFTWSPRILWAGPTEASKSQLSLCGAWRTWWESSNRPPTPPSTAAAAAATTATTTTLLTWCTTTTTYTWEGQPQHNNSYRMPELTRLLKVGGRKKRIEEKKMKRDEKEKKLRDKRKKRDDCRRHGLFLPSPPPTVPPLRHRHYRHRHRLCRPFPYPRLQPIILSSCS